MTVKRKGEPVTGTLFDSQDQVVNVRCMGIINGDAALAREGACLALYYHTMLLAHKDGYDGVDFGDSRPFLSDGALRYNLKWGMKALDFDDHVGAFALAAPGRSQAALSFLSSNRSFEIKDHGIGLCDDY